MTDLAEKKNAARKAGFVARKSVHDTTGTAALAMMSHVLAELGKTEGSLCISAYLPIRTEIDTLPLMNALHERGHTVCVPVIEGPARPLVFREWTPGTPLEKGAFDVEIPVKGAWVTPRILLSPLLSFTPDCYRLGYGGGFYDRTIAALSRDGDVRAYGLAYSGQRVESLPLESTDMQLSAVVTEKGIVRPS